MNDGLRSHALFFHPCQPKERRSNLLPLKTHVIVNLRSGAARRAYPLVEQFARRRGCTLTVTRHARHACELATEALAEDSELIVAVGGDGTMNEVATAMVGTRATLGLVPCGSGNGLGRHLRIHGSATHALGILETGTPRLIDTGFADGHAFFCAAGLGFEAEIARRFNTLERRGFTRYLATAARAFARWTPETYTVHAGAEVIRLSAFTLAVANADQYGNNARIAPGARIDDGELDLTAVPPLSPLNALPLALRLFRGSLGSVPEVLRRRNARFVIERAAPGLLHTDGELHPAGARIEFVVRARSLRVMAPTEQRR
jgi:diacylglycerol kinase family enzyme